MFHSDDSPIRIQATPDCLRLIEEVHEVHPGLVVLLDDSGVRLVTEPRADQEVIYLGDLETTSQTRCYAAAASQTAWWRHQATLDLPAAGELTAPDALDLSLAELTDVELAAAVASGPLPRGLRR